MKKFTLDEFMELLEPQYKEAQRLTQWTVEGLTKYAAETAFAKDGNWLDKVQTARNTIACLIPYWGLDMKPDGSYYETGHLKKFDDAVEKAAEKQIRPLEPTDYLKTNALLGLTRYALEMAATDGIEAKEYITEVQSLMSELANHWGGLNYYLGQMNGVINKELDAMTPPEQSQTLGM